MTGNDTHRAEGGRSAPKAREPVRSVSGVAMMAIPFTVREPIKLFGNKGRTNGRQGVAWRVGSVHVWHSREVVRVRAERKARGR